MSKPLTFPSLTGQELAALRRAAGLTQAQLSHLAGISRHAVSYWEQKAHVKRCMWAPRHMLRVLGIPILPPVVPHHATSTRAHARVRHGVLLKIEEYVAAAIAREEARPAAKEMARQARKADRKKITQDRFIAWEKAAQARQRVPCGAQTRKGEPCRMLSVPRRARCKHHGGMSTGPKTAEGLIRIAEAQRRRWSEWAAARVQSQVEDAATAQIGSQTSSGAPCSTFQPPSTGAESPRDRR